MPSSQGSGGQLSKLQVFAFYRANKKQEEETLPKALRTKALTALTRKFSLVGSVLQVWFGRFGLVGLVR